MDCLFYKFWQSRFLWLPYVVSLTDVLSPIFRINWWLDLESLSNSGLIFFFPLNFSSSFATSHSVTLSKCLKLAELHLSFSECLTQLLWKLDEIAAYGEPVHSAHIYQVSLPSPHTSFYMLQNNLQVFVFKNYSVAASQYYLQSQSLAYYYKSLLRLVFRGTGALKSR